MPHNFSLGTPNTHCPGEDWILFCTDNIIGVRHPDLDGKVNSRNFNKIVEKDLDSASNGLDNLAGS